MTNQLHDFNPGIAPNGLFWTVRIPDHALTVRDHTAHLKLVDQPVIDSHAFGLPDAVPSRVSVDMIWHAVGPPVCYTPGSTDPTDPSSFAAEFRSAVATGTFSGCSAEGFSFHGTASSEGVFAEMGYERNGVFLHDDHAIQPDLAQTQGFDAGELANLGDLASALPNPARTGVDFALVTREPGPIEVRVFDAAGRLVANLGEPGSSGAGHHVLHWDLRDLGGTRVAPGIYLARIQSHSGTESRRLVVLD